MSSVEYGLPAGHWRQTISKGNAVTQTYFNAFWRPVMTRSFDAADEAATRKVVTKQYDADGHATYESYPARDIASYDATPAGIRTTYDALGRPIQTQADSEQGVLTSTTNYLAGFQTQTTNPRGKTATQSFWALDDPAQAQLASIAAPEGVSVSISRDAFGKPTAITRGGTSVNTNAGYTSSVTRRYVYDAGQRLCRTIEPEVGSTVQVYDAASNVAWKAPGMNVPDDGACNEGYVPAAAKISYGYDALNRLTSTGYGDASPGITRSYTPDGLLQTIASNGGTWTYGYNALRKLATESFNYAGLSYDFALGLQHGRRPQRAGLPGRRHRCQLRPQRAGRAHQRQRLCLGHQPPPQRRGRRLHAEQQHRPQPHAEHPRPAAREPRRGRDAGPVRLRRQRQRHRHHRPAGGRLPPQHGLRRPGPPGQRQRAQCLG